MKMGLEAAAALSLPPSISEFFKPPASPSTEIMAAAVSTLTACKVGYSSSGRERIHLDSI